VSSTTQISHASFAELPASGFVPWTIEFPYVAVPAGLPTTGVPSVAGANTG